VADAEVAVAVPDEVSDEAAAHMLVNPLTAVRREAQEQLAFGYDGLLVQAGLRRAASVRRATAKQIAIALKDQFDVAATYGLDELGDAVEHAVRPGKIGTVLVRP
jgi:hypothetical protein